MPGAQYLDLAIERSGDRYRAHMPAPLAGQASAEFRPPVSDRDLRSFFLCIGQPRQQPYRVARLGDISRRKIVEQFGAKPYQAAFADEAHAGLPVETPLVRCLDPSVADPYGRVLSSVDHFHQRPVDRGPSAHPRCFHPTPRHRRPVRRVGDNGAGGHHYGGHRTGTQSQAGMGEHNPRGAQALLVGR